MSQRTPADIRLSLPDELGLTLRAAGSISGEDVFPCAPHAVDKRMSVVRSVSGASRSRLNTGVYCRDGDWSLEFSEAKTLDIEPGKAVEAGLSCNVEARGVAISLKFTPHLYRDGLGLAYFCPAEYSLPSRVPSGWISWKAYKGAVTQADIRKVADWAAANLKDYGLEYLIIDDGWFVGSNRTMLHSVLDGTDWTRGNDGFADGMGALADYVHDRGLKVGLWFTPFGCSTKKLLDEHPDWWVHRGAGGEILKSSWHGQAFVDSTNAEAISQWLVRGIRANAAAGIDYFKIDGQKHTAYDAYEKSGDYFTAKNTTWEDALRTGWSAIRRAAGDRYVLACWGRVPQIAGYPLAIRIGSDKDSSWKSVVAAAQDLSQWFHEHNIVWCDDPDHMVFVKLNAAECRTWATLLGLTGTHLTFSDTIDVYTPEKLNILRRILPVIHSPATRPAELYRIADPPALWTLEVDRPYDHWLVVANSTVGKPVETLQFEELGLSPDKDYAVYDFWNDEFKGVHRGSYACGLPGEHDTQVFSLREVRKYPWVVSTNRHVSQGGVDLQEVTWDADKRALDGVSDVVAGDPYAVTIHAPQGYAVASAKFGEQAAEVVALEHAVKMRFTPTPTGVVRWSVQFSAVRE